MYNGKATEKLIDRLKISPITRDEACLITSSSQIWRLTRDGVFETFDDISPKFEKNIKHAHAICQWVRLGSVEYKHRKRFPERAISKAIELLEAHDYIVTKK